ncbi:MAG: sigma-70 family RNA polymerase sigma factor [Ilumatobacteraceae bacterium]
MFAREYGPLCRLAVSLVDDPGRAEELVQDCFARALPRWEQLDNPGGYLRRGVVNAARSELRKRRIRRRTPNPPEGFAQLPERDRQLLDAVARLSPRRRIAVTLRVLEDRSEAETAELMGCSLGTVKSLTSRGLDDLRKVVTR